jgi:hypothetical protein
VTLVLFVGAVHPASAEWTLGVFLGGARTQDTSIRLTQGPLSTDVVLSPVRYRSDSLEGPVYYAYRVGFFPRSAWLGIEGEFIHVKVIAETSRPVMMEGVVRGEPIAESRPVGAVLEQFSITHGVNLLLVNVVARRAIHGTHGLPPRWFFTGRFGVGASVPHPESRIEGATLEQYEWGSVSFQGAAGVELRMTERWYLSGEYKLTHSAQNVSVVGGSARTPLTTHHLAAGVVVHVGKVGRPH